MKVLVTGSAGFIGAATVRRLLEEGHQVVGMDIKERKAQDVTDPIAVMDMFHHADPDVVYHFAAQSSVSQSLRQPIIDAHTNYIGTVVVANACRVRGSKLIYSSSGGTLYGSQFPMYEDSGPVFRPFLEDDTPNPSSSPYSISKYAAELYIRSVRDLDWCILRYANVYGPGQDPHGESGVISIFAEQLRTGRPAMIRGDGKHTRDYVYIDDVVDANIRAIDWQRGIYNIGRGINYSVIDVLHTVARVLGVKPKREHIPAIQEVAHVSLDCIHAAEEGWRPRIGLDEGIKRTLQGRAVAAHGPHKPEVAGSTPAPATTPRNN